MLLYSLGTPLAVPDPPQSLKASVTQRGSPAWYPCSFRPVLNSRWDWPQAVCWQFVSIGTRLLDEDYIQINMITL